MTKTRSSPRAVKAALASFKILPPLIKFIPVIVVALVIGAALLASRLSLFERVQKEQELSPEAMAEIQVNEGVYISDMVALHQEVVDSSRYVLGKTTDEEVKSFADQQMKSGTQNTWKLIGWHQELHGKDFPKASEIQKRVPDLTIHAGKDLERVYLQGMIDSDKEVMSRSKALILVTQEDKLKQFASDLVIEKEKDIEKLKAWVEKYQK
jgi:uncharacterized protein (DUF305 family)